MKANQIFFLVLILMFLMVGCGISRKVSKTIQENYESDVGSEAEHNKVSEDLFYAAYSGDIKRAKLLIQNGSDINAQDEIGETALHIAIGWGHWEMAQVLVNLGADVNVISERGQTPLLLLVDSYSTEENEEYHKMVKLLVAHGANVNIKDNDGRTPLHWVSGGKYRDLGELFIEKGADVNARDSSGQTPLHEAAASCNRELIELFTAAVADINAKDDIGRTALHILIDGEIVFDSYNEIVDIVRLLVDSGADVDAADGYGATPLTLAVDTYQKEIAQLLIEKSKNVNIQHAAFVGDLEMVKGFIYSDTDINDRDKKGRTALHTAASGGNLDVVTLLLKLGTDVNFTDNAGLTPLHYAAGAGSIKIAEILIQEGANVDARTKEGVTPLHKAASDGCVDIVRLLITEGVNVNAINDNGWTALHVVAGSESWNDLEDFWAAPDQTNLMKDIAYINRYIDTVRILLDNGADVNIKNEDGRTPLHIAASFTPGSLFDFGIGRPTANDKGHKNLAALLINAGADINARDKNGMTPLHIAARDGNKGVVQLLLDNKAAVNSMDDKGKTPLDYAKTGNMEEITEILKATGGKSGR